LAQLLETRLKRETVGQGRGSEMKNTILFKLNQVARLRLFSGLKDGQIATLMNLSQSGFSRLLTLPEYQEIETQLLEGGVTKLDEQVAGKIDEMRELYKPAVPAAMRTLLEVVTQRRDLRAAVAASIQVLDRDPDQTFVATGKREANAQGVNAVGVPAGVLASAISAGAGVASAVAAAQPKTSSSVKDMN
jgi:hypothetical protein